MYTICFADIAPMILATATNTVLNIIDLDVYKSAVVEATSAFPGEKLN